MKKWICIECARRGETEDNIVMKICKACQVEMEIINEVGNEKM